MSKIASANMKNFNLSYTIGIGNVKTKFIHCHSIYELYFYKAGNVEYYIEGKKYLLKPDTLLLMGPQTFHGFTVEQEESYERYVINFGDDCISEECLPYLKAIYDNSHNDMRHCYPNAKEFFVGEYLDNILNCEKMPSPLKERAIRTNFEALIYQIYYMKISCNQKIINHQTTPDKIKEMIIYINAHLDENFTLDELSSQFYISKHHLNKVFKQAAGTTVMEYILYKKMAYAQKLVQKGEQITKVSEMLGFFDYSTFFRNYTKVNGHSPSADR